MLFTAGHSIEPSFALEKEEYVDFFLHDMSTYCKTQVMMHSKYDNTVRGSLTQIRYS